VGIRIDQTGLKEGMVLAEPVLNRQGQTLLPAGTALTARHITVFKTWGIANAVIESGAGGGKGPDAGMSKETVARAMARLNRRWLWKPRNAIEKEVYVLAVKRAAELPVDQGKE